MSTSDAARTVLDGLCFPEGPRWHEGRLWLSDMHDHRVLALADGGEVETVVRVPAKPSGLGWLPDGRLLVVSMEDRRLLRLDPDGLHEVADLSALASFHCNDMVVDGAGGAYVGNFGFDLHAKAPFRKAEIVRVEPDGRARVVAADLAFPNGMVITPDGRTLVVAESFAARLTAFRIRADGGLDEPRPWARLEGAVPDGICLDAEGAIWLASPVSREVLRVREGGQVSARHAVGGQAVACMLGGPERRTLYVCTAESLDPAETVRTRRGRVVAIDVGVPGAGLP